MRSHCRIKCTRTRTAQARRHSCRLIQCHIPQWQSGLYCNLIRKEAIQKWWCWNLFDLIKSSCHRGSDSLKGCAAPWKWALMWLHWWPVSNWLGQLTRPPQLPTHNLWERTSCTVRDCHVLHTFLEAQCSVICWPFLKGTVCLADSTHLLGLHLVRN